MAKITYPTPPDEIKDLDVSPQSYSGQAGKYLKVNATESGFEFGAPAGAGDMLQATYDPDLDGVIASAQLGTNVVVEADVDDVAVNGATTDPISSNWAFD